MAIAFREKSTTTGLSTSLTLNKPTGTADGDFLVVGIAANLATPGLGAPAGWTLLDSYAPSGSSCTWYWKIASSEGASWTWTCTNLRFAAYCMAFSGTFLAATVINAHGTGDAGTGTSLVAGTITTSLANTMVIAAVSQAGSPGTFTPPAGMTERVDVSEVNVEAITAASVAQAGAGATGTKTFTASSSSSGSAYSTLAIAEAVPPTVTSLTPAYDVLAGGRAVTITGTNFTAAGYGSNAVTLKGVSATSVVTVSDTTITCVPGAGSVGVGDVVVTNTNGSGTKTNGWTYIDALDNVVKLVKGGAVVGDNQASATKWPVADSQAQYGGYSNLWGTTLTPAEVMASDFGVVLSATVNGGTAKVDAATVTVYYSMPANSDPQSLLVALNVDDDGAICTPQIYSLPRAGLTLGQDPNVAKATSEATLYASRYYRPHRNVLKTWREFSFWLDADPETNAPGLQVWFSVDNGTAYKLRDAAGAVATFRTTGPHRAWFPTTSAATGYYAQPILKVPALSGGEQVAAYRVKGMALRGSWRPNSTEVITAQLVLGVGEVEDRRSMRRSPAQQEAELFALADAQVPIAYRDPSGDEGYAVLVAVETREVRFTNESQPVKVATIRMRRTTYS